MIGGPEAFGVGEGLDGFWCTVSGDWEKHFSPLTERMTVEEAIGAGLLSPFALYPSFDGLGRLLDEYGDPAPTAYGGLVDAALPEGGPDAGIQIATPPPIDKEYN